MSARTFSPFFHQWTRESAAPSLHVKHTVFAYLEALTVKYFSEADSWQRSETGIRFPFKDNAADGAVLTGRIS